VAPALGGAGCAFAKAQPELLRQHNHHTITCGHNGSVTKGKTATKKLREMTCLTSMNCNAGARAQGTDVWLWPCNGSIGKEKMKTRKAISNDPSSFSN